ncbi:ABC transporter permease [Desulfonatronum thioautotrophicum]|uniref:ABC transporter permease n=1 Tax=Desulfonatronum thioautotrophicum TaxID=617001 RepID=UPI0005EB6006|nr:ABC transporter permease [Desulfonatronum thioautotrophicum]
MHHYVTPDTSFTAPLQTAFRHRHLILELTRRDIAMRYRGSLMGITWSFLIPLLMLIVYTLFFTLIFNARWGLSENETRTDFAVILFVGLLIHGFFADCINRSPGLIISNVNYVKKVVFPLEILPFVMLGSALFHIALSLLVLFLAMLLLSHQISWTALLFPIVFLPLIFTTLGLAWLLSSLGVFIRDIGQITNVFTTILLFASGVFFPLSSIPPPYRDFLALNPLAYIIEQSRDVLLFGTLPGGVGLLASLLAGLVITWAGYWWFQKTRNGFADVL